MPRFRPAFSLIEVVLALGVVAVAVLALIGIMGSTFTSARELALQHRAINAINALDGALQNPRSITGLTPDASTTSPFDQTFKALVPNGGLTGTGFHDFLVFTKSKDGTTGHGAASTAAIPAIVDLTSAAPTLEQVMTQIAAGGKTTYAGADVNSMFRLRVRVSKLMEGKLYQLDTTTYEPKPTTWTTGQPLGTTADDYALAYLPLSIEVYPCDLTDSTDPTKNPDLKPILTQTMVLNR